MKTERITINGLTGNEIIFREGPARAVFIPLPMNISGNIDTPLRYIEKQKAYFPIYGTTADGKSIFMAHVIVDRENMAMALFVHPKSEDPDKITGKLELHEDFVKFGINSGKELTTTALAELFKMNRSAFKDKETAMKLVKDLRSFKAKVDKDIEKHSDDRANFTMHKSQAVDSNIPASFQLVVPIFKGEHALTFQVEININAENLNCSLISPEVNDYIAVEKNKIIDEQIKKIQEVMPELLIIEV